MALNSCRLNEFCLEALNDALGMIDSLKELFLYSNDFGPNEATYVGLIIENKRKLTSLGLSNNTIYETGAKILAEKLGGKPNL